MTVAAVGAFFRGGNMAKLFAKSFYGSHKWKKCRNGYIHQRILIDGGICEVCKDNVGYIVHHKETITEENINNPEVTLNYGNLMYVCKKCHDRFEGHGIGMKSAPAFCKFDEDGQPISLRKIDIAPH